MFEKKVAVIAGIITTALVIGAGAGSVLHFTRDAYRCEKNMKLAAASYEAGEYAKAATYYEKALQLDNSLVEAYMSAAESYFALERYEEAVEILRKGIRESGAHEESLELFSEKLAEAYLMEADIYQETGDYIKAIAAMDALGDESMTERKVGLYLAASDVFFADGQYEEAVEILMEGEKDTESSALAEREAWLRENIVILWERYYKPYSGIETYIEYDALGNMIRAVPYNEAGDIIGIWSGWEYDTSGNKIKEISYLADGGIESWYEWEYDSSGKELRHSLYIISYKGDGSIEYNEDGSTNYKCESANFYKYDISGNLIKDTHFAGVRGIQSWDEYEYDSEGNKIKKTRYDERTESIEYWWEYEYDASGNKIKSVKYGEDGSIDCLEEREYDASGNEIKWVSYDKYGSIDFLEEREYDASGK